MADLTAVIVIICVLAIWLLACIALSTNDKPEEDYPTTEAKSKTFCETIKEDKNNVRNINKT